MIGCGWIQEQLLMPKFSFLFALNSSFKISWPRHSALYNKRKKHTEVRLRTLVKAFSGESYIYITEKLETHFTTEV